MGRGGEGGGGGGGLWWLSCVETQLSLPFREPLALATKIARGKRTPPRAGCWKPLRVKRSSLSGWPQAPFRSPSSPLSIFPRGRTPVPRWGTSGFPLLEKNPKTQEVPWRSRLGPTRGESSPTFNFAKHESPEKKTRSYWCAHPKACGMRVMPLENANAHALRCHCACAK